MTMRFHLFTFLVVFRVYDADGNEYLDQQVFIDVASKGFEMFSVSLLVGESRYVIAQYVYIFHNNCLRLSVLL